MSCGMQVSGVWRKRKRRVIVAMVIDKSDTLFRNLCMCRSILVFSVMNFFTLFVRDRGLFYFCCFGLSYTLLWVNHNILCLSIIGVSVQHTSIELEPMYVGILYLLYFNVSVNCKTRSNTWRYG